jgi:NitT/TauT family transport system substrate-binding protein
VRARPDFTLILAGKGSPLEGKPADLAGKTVAVNTLNNLGELAVRSNVKQAGGDPAAVKLVEVPFPEMGAALERGDVDAIWAVEPFATLAKGSGAVVVADSYTGPLENFPVAGYQVTKQFADDNPNTVAAFQRAITAASETARSNPDRVRQMLPTSAKVPAAVAKEVALPEYLASIDQAQFQRVVDYLNEFGILKQQLQAGELVIAPPS